MLDQINIQYYSIPETIDIELENESVSTFVVLRDSDWTDQTKELLLKMLKAVKLAENQYQIVTITSAKTLAVSSLCQSPHCKILVFGMGPVDLQMNCRASLYTQTRLEECTLLFSDSLTNLIQKPQLKKPLWSALQSMYS